MPSTPSKGAGTSPEEPHSYPQLTKYERTLIVGLRAEQLARGAQPFVPLEQPSRIPSLTAIEALYDAAERELKERKLPFTVVRQMLDGSTDRIRIAELR